MDERREPSVMPGTDVGTTPQPGPIPPATCAVLAPAHPASEPLDGSGGRSGPSDASKHEAAPSDATRPAPSLPTRRGGRVRLSVALT
jgi:hypothetical protein